jgi:hypothetical protein
MGKRARALSAVKKKWLSPPGRQTFRFFFPSDP